MDAHTWQENLLSAKFSCQAMVNLVWSFASILGAQCACNAHIFEMFKNVRKEAIVRCAYFMDEQDWTERDYNRVKEGQRLPLP
eukprot:1154686-Pelagomonas_calceolata.AAC.5